MRQIFDNKIILENGNKLLFTTMGGGIIRGPATIWGYIIFLYCVNDVKNLNYSN